MGEEANFSPVPGRSAKYNSGLFQTIRLNKLIDRIQDCSVAPLSENSDFNKPNYIIVKNDCDSILELELQPKMSRDEFKGMLNLRKCLEDFMINNSIIVRRNNKQQFDEKVFRVLWNAICDYRSKIMLLVDKLGLGNPDARDAGAAVVDMN